MTQIPKNRNQAMPGDMNSSDHFSMELQRHFTTGSSKIGLLLTAKMLTQFPKVTGYIKSFLQSNEMLRH